MKKILIFHTAFIGDIVLSTPLIKKIKSLYNCKIDYVTTKAGSLILQNNPYLDNIFIYDKKGKDKGIKGAFNLVKKLRKENYDIAFVPHRYLRSSLIVFFSKIPVRIGYKNSEGKIFLNKLIEYRKDLHEVDRLLQLVQGINADILEKKIELFPNKNNQKKIDEIFEKNNIKNQKIIVIAPGSKWYTKMWPTEYFNEVIKRLENIENLKVILIGGKDEEKLKLIQTKNSVNLIGKTSLLDLAEIMKRADIVLTNDSSPIHIASAFEKPYIFAIFGATVKELGFYPYSKTSEIIENKGLYCRPCGLHGGNNCPEGHFKCMKQIKPDYVYEKIVKKLGENNG
ncbi:heptosyltransferase-2 [Hypnocyclicus thermotrophus]|uniref:lipopolysaccharide heptosyltransferase II n=1 Tax=Hypnocyclicus thermotrophus TaxID=1627895 RepID=A0AA46I5L4_9FUSO|nr:lipopolysaccharide heptosyltransferase II [Hypnocyclicus thermotrophus]TDT70611.1 heptosyltransferase-2 [Hypnocyclicus thermotrophus]